MCNCIENRYDKISLYNNIPFRNSPLHLSINNNRKRIYPEINLCFVLYFRFNSQKKSWWRYYVSKEEKSLLRTIIKFNLKLNLGEINIGYSLNYFQQQAILSDKFNIAN